jgi:glucose-6-phosphate isomerase
VFDLSQTSGLPLSADEKGKLTFGNGLPPVRADIRYKKDMLDVLYEPEGDGPDELYFMYRDICRPEDRDLLQKHKLRYDVTAILSGYVGKEFIKTAGHYHPIKPGTEMTYPEVYEVLHGTAHYLLQTDSDEDGVEAILVEAKAGDKVLIPPGYGHITINPGPSILIMSNWVCSDFASVYGPIKEWGGAAYFEVADGKESQFIVNPRYQPTPRLSTRNVEDMPEFGLVRGRPMYPEFLKAPEKFGFLPDPERFF